MSATPGEKFRFVSQSAAEEAFHVVRFSGSEGLNSLYRFEIVLATDHLVSVDGLLTKPAELVLLRDGKSTVFSGYLSSATQTTHYNGYTFYTVVLQPKFWKLTQIRQTRIYLENNVEELVGEAIKVDEVFRIKTRFNLLGDYPKSEFTLQYDESVYDYIANKLEYEGVYYYFEQGDAAAGDSSERVVFTDSHLGHEPLGETPSLRYSPVSGLEASHAEEVVTALALGKTPLPRNVVLRSYDWMNPNEPLIVEAQVSPRGLGEVYYSDNRFVTREEGKRLARIRAEELACRGTTFTGVSAVPTLRPGYQFTLENHYDDTFNTSYLITGITHEGSQEAYLASVLGLRLEKGDDHHYYRNTFTAILADTPFRPAQVTPRAKVQGLMTAFIDGAGKGDTPELDEHGRYKVVFAFDMSGRKQGKASCWLRMSQPHVGKGFGTAFPLTPGVEVTVAFVEGDPDRPLITGALANTETGPLVSNTNTNLSGMTTSKGNSLLFSEEGGKQGLALFTASGRSGLSMQSGSAEVTHCKADAVLDVANLVSSSIYGVGKTAWSGFREAKFTGQTLDTFAMKAVINAFEGFGTMSNAYAAESEGVAQALWKGGSLCAKLAALLMPTLFGKGKHSIYKEAPYKYSISAKNGCTKSLQLTGPTKSEFIAYSLAGFLPMAASAGFDLGKATRKADNDLAADNAAADKKKAAYKNDIKSLIKTYCTNKNFSSEKMTDENFCTVVNGTISCEAADGTTQSCPALFPAIQEKIRQTTDAGKQREVRADAKKLLDAYDYCCGGGYELEKQRNKAKCDASSKVVALRDMALKKGEELLPEVMAYLLTFVPLYCRLRGKDMGGILLETDSNTLAFSALDTLIGTNKRILLAAGDGAESSLQVAGEVEDTQLGKFVDALGANLDLPADQSAILLSSPLVGINAEKFEMLNDKTNAEAITSITLDVNTNTALAKRVTYLRGVRSRQEIELKDVQTELMKVMESKLILSESIAARVKLQQRFGEVGKLVLATEAALKAYELNAPLATRHALFLNTEQAKTFLLSRSADATLRVERSSKGHGDECVAPAQSMDLKKDSLTLTHEPLAGSTATIKLTGADADARAIELVIGECKAILKKDSIELKSGGEGGQILLNAEGVTIKGKTITLDGGGKQSTFKGDGITFPGIPFKGSSSASIS